MSYVVHIRIEWLTDRRSHMKFNARLTGTAFKSNTCVVRTTHSSKMAIRKVSDQSGVQYDIFSKIIIKFIQELACSTVLM